MTFIRCEAGRVLNFKKITDPKGECVHVVVDRAGGDTVYRSSPTADSIGYLGSYRSGMRQLASSISYDTLVYGARACARCVGQPRRPCDISASNEDDRSPQIST